jgi:hypothetical protein
MFVLIRILYFYEMAQNQRAPHPPPLSLPEEFSAHHGHYILAGHGAPRVGIFERLH